MILTGTFYTDDIYEKWLEDKAMPIAKEVISAYPLLSNLFNSFQNIPLDSQNIVYLTAQPHILNDEVSASMKNRLSAIESVLSKVKFMEWNNEDKNYLIGELTSNDYYASSSPYNELLFYSLLDKMFLKKQLELYPKLDEGNKKSDIKLSYNNYKLFIEVGTLNETIPTKKIKKILNNVSKYFGDKIQNGSFHFEIDSSKLKLDANENIDIEKSCKRIKKEIDLLNIVDLRNTNVAIDVHDLIEYAQNESIYKDLIFEEYHLLPSIGDAFKNKTVLSWYEKNKLNFSDVKIINYFNCIENKLDKTFIEFHTEYMFPSKTAQLIHSSVINHIMRHIEEQSYQIKVDALNLIAIQVETLSLFIIGKRYVFHDDIIYKLKKYLSQSKFVDLLGVLLYDINNSKSMFITSNIQSEEKKEILNKFLSNFGVQIIV